MYQISKEKVVYPNSVLCSTSYKQSTFSIMTTAQMKRVNLLFQNKMVGLIPTATVKAKIAMISTANVLWKVPLSSFLIS